MKLRGSYLVSHNNRESSDSSLSPSGKEKPKLASTYVARSTCKLMTFRSQYLSSIAKRFVLERAIFTRSLSGRPGNKDGLACSRRRRGPPAVTTAYSYEIKPLNTRTG